MTYFKVVSALLLTLSATGLATPPVTNKLLQMYQVYYLPFSLEFSQGGSLNEIIPRLKDTTGKLRTVTQEELAKINAVWDAEKQALLKKSLFEKTPVGLNKSVRISEHLRSHKISVTRRALDSVPLAQKMQLMQAMEGKSEKVKALFKQLRFLKSFTSGLDLERFNFFVVSADWCESCREYRVMLESYFKQFPDRKVNLHSIVIEDPKEKVFDSAALKELFPNPKNYSHESIPRFLALETRNGQSQVLEEGKALEHFFQRYLKKHQGYLNEKVPFLKHLSTPRRLSSPQE